MLAIETINRKAVKEKLAAVFSIPESDIIFALDRITECLTLNFSIKGKKFEGFIVSRMSRVSMEAEYGYVLTLYPEGFYHPEASTTFEEFAAINMATMPRNALARHVSSMIIQGVLVVTKALSSPDPHEISEADQPCLEAARREQIDARLFSKKGVSRDPRLPNRDNL